jgi:hypothetical protein
MKRSLIVKALNTSQAIYRAKAHPFFANVDLNSLMAFAEVSGSA